MASIRERNGKFNVIYSYTNEKGERKQKWETYETKAEAKRRKKEIEYKKEMGSFVVRKCKTLDELITEYVALYGKENWALSTYEGNVSLINNYILPIIGDAKLSEINTRFIERYYQSLLKRRKIPFRIAGSLQFFHDQAQKNKFRQLFEDGSEYSHFHYHCQSVPRYLILSVAVHLPGSSCENFS